MTEYKNEAALVADIWNRIKDKYPKAYLVKIHGGMYQEAGIPDLMLCVNGLLVGIEAKHIKPAETKAHAVSRTTLRQRIHIRRIVEAGGMSGVATSVEDAMYLIQLAHQKQRMIQEGRPTDDFPKPPFWDVLMRADKASIIPEPPVISPVPIKKRSKK